jgi:hypothetical protein
MAYNPANLVLGPATMYVAPFGTTEPLDSTITPSPGPPSSPWTDVGGTDGGVMLEVDGTYTDLSIDQVIMPVGSRLTDLKASVTTKMSEITFANLQTALNGILSIGSGSGYATAELTVTSVATQPIYAALLIDGWAPFLSTGLPARRRCIIRKVLSTPKAILTYDRKTQESVDVVMSAYFVSNSVNPIHWVDQQA